MKFWSFPLQAQHNHHWTRLCILIFVYVCIDIQISIDPLIPCPLYPFPPSLSLAAFIREAQFSAKGSDSDIDAGSVCQRWASMSPFVCKSIQFIAMLEDLKQADKMQVSCCAWDNVQGCGSFLCPALIFWSSWEQTCLFLLWSALISYDLDLNLSRLLLCCIHRSWTKATDSRTYVPVSRAKSVNITAVVKFDFENRTSDLSCVEL